MIDSLVSVVIPTRGRPEFLYKAIESVLGQSYKHLEILVVDDDERGSSVKEIEEIDDRRVRYLSTGGGKGPGYARNAGIRTAQGAFVAFLDDDDLWLPGKLSVQMDALALNPHLLFVSTDKITFPYRNRDMELSLRRDRVVSYRELLLQCIVNNSSVVMRREVTELVGLLEEREDVIEDYDYWLRILAARDRSLLVLKEKLLLYRIHKGNTSGGQGLLDRLEKEYARLKPVYQKHAAAQPEVVRKAARSWKDRIQYLRALQRIKAGREGPLTSAIRTCVSLPYRVRILLKGMLVKVRTR